MAKRRSVEDAIGELSFMNPTRRGASARDDTPSEPANDQGVVVRDTAEQPQRSAAPRRQTRRKRRPAALMRAEVRLPEDILQRARSAVRPRHTGAERSLGAAFLLQAYIRAVDDLDPAIDLSGLDAGMEDEAVERVKQALTDALAAPADTANANGS